MFVLCYPENNPFTLVVCVCVFVICCKDILLIIGIKDKKSPATLTGGRTADVRIYPQNGEIIMSME